MSSATPGQVGSPEPMSTTSTRPSKRSLESPEQQARGEGEDDRTKRRRSDEDASVGRAEQRTASSSRAASAMERGIREMELQDQQPDRAPVVSAADQRTSVDRDASASDIDMDVDEPQASSSAAQLSTVSQSRFGVRLPTISSFDRGGPHSSSSDDDPWLTPNETPQGSQHRARSPPSTEAVRSEFARAQRFSDTLAPLRRSPSPRPAPQAEHTPGHFGDFLSRLRPVVRESTPPSSATGSTFHWDPYSQMGATAPNALPERHAPLSLSLPRSQNSSRSSGTVLPHLGASERLAQVPTSPPHPLFEASWLRHPSVGGPSMLPAGQAGVRHQPPPAPHSPLLHPSLHSPPPPRSPPDSPPRGHFSLPPHFRRSSGSPASPYSDESDIAPTIFPGSPYPRFAPSPGPYVHHPDLPRNSSRERDPRDNEPQSQQVPRSQAPVLPNFGSTSPRQFSQPASPVQPQNGPYNAGTNTDRSESRATARSRDTGHNQMRLPPIRTRGPLPRLSSVVAGFPDEQPASRQEEHNVLSNAAASSRQILETLIRMREANSHRPPPETNESMTIDRNRAQTIAENEQDLGQYWTSTRAAVQPQTSNVREQAPRQDVAQRSTRRDGAGVGDLPGTSSDVANRLPSLDSLGGLPSTRLMPPPSSSPATPWSIWRTTEPEDRSFTLPHERRHPTQILELSQLLNEVQERTDRVQSSLQRARAPDDVPVIRVEPPRMTQDRGSSRDMPAPLPIFARENSLGLEMEIAPDTANSPRPSNIIAPAPPRSVTPVAGELMVTTELGMTRERMVEALNALHRDRLELRERIITARLAGLTTSHLEEAARQLRSASHGLRGGIAAEARARQIAPNRSGSAALLASRPVAHRRNTSDERGQAEFVRLMSETEPLLAEHRRTGAAIRQLVGERTVDVTQDPLTSVVNPGPSIGPLTRQDAERVARDAARDAARAEDFLRAYRLEAPAQFGRERITGADAGRDSVLRRRMPAYLRSSVDGESNPRPHDPSRANSPSPPPVPPRPSPSSRYDPVRDTDRDVHMESARPRMRAVPLTPMGVDYPLYNGRNVATFRQQVRSRERPSSSFSAVSSLQNTVATQASSATDPHLERLSARNAVLQEELRSRTAALEASTQERDRAYIRSRLRRWDDNMSSSRPGERPPSLFSSTLVTDDDMDISSDTEGLATATSTAPGRRSRLAPPRLEAGRDVQSGAEQLRENLRQRREQRRNEHVLRQRTVHRYRPETSEDSEARDRRMRAYESSWTNILAERQARQGQPTPTSQPRATTSQTNLATPTSGTSRPTINVPPSRNESAVAAFLRQSYSEEYAAEPRERLSRLLNRTGRASGNDRGDMWSPLYPQTNWRGHSRLSDYMSDNDMSYEALLRLSDRIGTHPRGVSPDTITRLHSGLYRDEQEAAENRNCSICLEEYNPDDTVTHLDSCPHWFHKSCIETWLSRARTCPCCRATVGNARASSSHAAGPSEPRGGGNFFAMLSRYPPPAQTGNLTSTQPQQQARQQPSQHQSQSQYATPEPRAHIETQLALSNFPAPWTTRVLTPPPYHGSPLPMNQTPPPYHGSPLPMNQTPPPYNGPPLSMNAYIPASDLERPLPPLPSGSVDPPAPPIRHPLPQMPTQSQETSNQPQQRPQPSTRVRSISPYVFSSDGDDETYMAYFNFDSEDSAVFDVLERGGRR